MPGGCLGIKEDYFGVQCAGSGGVCTFCGARVALTYGEHSQQVHAAKAQPSTAAGTKGAPEVSAATETAAAADTEAGDQKTVEAVAFKDRLVRL